MIKLVAICVRGEPTLCIQVALLPECFLRADLKPTLALDDSV